MFQAGTTKASARAKADAAGISHDRRIKAILSGRDAFCWARAGLNATDVSQALLNPATTKTAE